MGSRELMRELVSLKHGLGVGRDSEPGVEDEASRTGLLAPLIGEVEQILFDLELVFDEWNVGIAGGSRL